MRLTWYKLICQQTSRHHPARPPTTCSRASRRAACVRRMRHTPAHVHVRTRTLAHVPFASGLCGWCMCIDMCIDIVYRRVYRNVYRRASEHALQASIGHGATLMVRHKSKCIVAQPLEAKLELRKPLWTATLHRKAHTPPESSRRDGEKEYRHVHTRALGSASAMPMARL